MVLEAQQRRQFFLVEFFHTNADVVGQYEIEEDLLPGIEMRTDEGLRGRLIVPSFAADRSVGTPYYARSVRSALRRTRWL